MGKKWKRTSLQSFNMINENIWVDRAHVLWVKTTGNLEREKDERIVRRLFHRSAPKKCTISKGQKQE